MPLDQGYYDPGEVPAKPMHIAINVDPSPHTLAAARFVRDLLLPQGSRVTTLSVLEPKKTYNTHDVLKTLDEVASIMDGSGVEVKTELLQGSKTEQLLQYTQQNATDMLLVGANGLYKSFGVLMDGLPQQLVEAARCPVMVARAPYTKLRHVLLVVDFTWFSRRAVRYLAQFHLPPQAKVTVMHVQPPEDDPDSSTMIAEPQQMKTKSGVTAFFDRLQSGFKGQAAWLQTSRGVMRYATEVLRAAGVRVDSVVTQGDAAKMITSYARTNHVDMVIAGSRTLGKVASWITGDVTRKLIHSAGCSVMIVKDSSAKKLPAAAETEDNSLSDVA